jgi:hypothetical protein
MSKSLRTASVAASVLLHVALVSGLLLNPPKFELLHKEGAIVTGVRSELAPANAQSEEVIQKASRNSAPVKLQTSDNTNVTKPEKIPLAHSETAQTDNSEPDEKQAVKPALSGVTSNVIDSVRQLIAGSANGEPTDFAMMDGQFVRQDGDNEVATLSFLHLVGAANGPLSCSTTQDVQRALQSDPAIIESLASIPRSHRSVANVLMVWDATWVETEDRIGAVSAPRDTVAEPSLFQVRIQELVRGLSTQCANEIIQGPTFLVINTEAEPTILAFGSREWRWADLLLPTEPVRDASVEAFFLSSRPDFLNR